MAEENEEKYLDELLNSLMDSNTEEGNSPKTDDENSMASDMEEEKEVMDEPIEESMEEQPIPQQPETLESELVLEENDIEDNNMEENDADSLLDSLNEILEGGTPDMAGEEVIQEEEVTEEVTKESPLESPSIEEEIIEETSMNETDVKSAVETEDSDIFALEDFDSEEVPDMDELKDFDTLGNDELTEIDNEYRESAEESELDNIREILENTEQETGALDEASGKKAGFFEKIFGKLFKKKEKNPEKEKQPKEKKSKKKKAKQGTEIPETTATDNSALINEVYSDTDSLDAIPIAEGLDDIEEREEPVKKEKKKKEPKPKKEKKKKEPKPKKEKKPKVPPKPSELVKVTPFTFIKIVLFTAVVVSAVYFGSTALNYQSNINASKAYYESEKYDQAYDRIAGTDIQKKDMDYYNKLRTIMCVYMDYSSYLNYSKVGMMPEAVDKLIQGLVHYDTYYAVAEEYEVLEEYNAAKALIVNALGELGISEETAITYSQIENEEQYKEILQNIGGISE